MLFPSISNLFLGWLLSNPSLPIEPPASTVVPAEAPLPKWKLKFTAYLNVDLAAPHLTKIPQGRRFSVGFKGGNLTASDGSLLATVLPGIGAEHGFVDPEGFYHIRYRYSVQFPDGKYGFIHSEGFGVPAVSQKIFTRIETDSETNSDLLASVIYSNATFRGDWLVAPHWVPLG